MRDFIWKVQQWITTAYEATRAFIKRILPRADDKPEVRSLKIYVFLFVGIIGLMIVIGLVTFSIAVRGQPETLVPNLQGKDLTDALVALQDKSLFADVQVQFSTAEKDEVISQKPTAGTLVKTGKRVTLRVSRGPVLDKVESYIGWSLDDVKVHLQTLFATHNTPNVVIKTVVYQHRDGVASGKVLAQSPAAGTKITGVANLELVVSQDAGAVSMVSVGTYIGKSYQEAITELSQANIPFAFTVKKTSKGADPGSVIDQIPAGGTQMAYGQVVQLTMVAPTDVGKDNVFGLFTFPLEPQTIAVNVRLVLITDSVPRDLVAMKHPGGPVAVPYIVPAGSDLVLYVLDQEVARAKAQAIQY
jgi:eukaryotic-like serine/threonine-protein kinase